MTQQNPVEIKIAPEEAAGSYANLMLAQHTSEEFILDFLSVFPPSGKLVSRIIMSPGHLKRTIAALTTQLKKYEGEHGEVTETQIPEEPKFGF